MSKPVRWQDWLDWAKEKWSIGPEHPVCRFIQNKMVSGQQSPGIPPDELEKFLCKMYADTGKAPKAAPKAKAKPVKKAAVKVAKAAKKPAKKVAKVAKKAGKKAGKKKKKKGR